MNKFYRTFYKIVFPVNCLNCGSESDWLCPLCLKELPISRGDLCCLCGRAGLNGICEVCAKITKLDGIVSLFSYSQPAVQEIIRRSKFLKQFDGLYFICYAYRRQILKRVFQQDWTVVPIPLSSNRQKERGFNQAEDIARNLFRQQFPINNYLTRVKNTKAQAKLTKSKRLQNVKGCFKIKEPQDLPASILLIDDVITTGSTLAEAAKLLKKNGVKTVWALTLAHG